LSQISSDIKNKITHEIISPLTARVGKTCISSIQKATYYGIMFDMTLDGMHIGQMSKLSDLFRFSDTMRKSKKCFGLSLACLENYRGNDKITNKLEQDRLNFEECRGQSYENQKQ
jgi:hypothetical protein